MKTFSAKPHEAQRDWYIVDASDKVLGRLAAAIAHRLRGKHKAEFTPLVDTGDYIVVVNADKLRVTGNNEDLARLRLAHFKLPSTECSDMWQAVTRAVALS